jgi:hypothetical protein
LEKDISDNKHHDKHGGKTHLWKRMAGKVPGENKGQSMDYAGYIGYF